MVWLPVSSVGESGFIFPSRRDNHIFLDSQDGFFYTPLLKKRVLGIVSWDIDR